MAKRKRRGFTKEFKAAEHRRRADVGLEPVDTWARSAGKRRNRGSWRTNKWQWESRAGERLIRVLSTAISRCEAGRLPPQAEASQIPTLDSNKVLSLPRGPSPRILRML